MNHIEDEPLDPAAALALVERQKNAVALLFTRPVIALLLVWGVAWFVGFLLLWSAADGGNPWFRVPPLAAGIAFAALIAVSIVISAIVGSRIGRGVRGASDFPVTVYGLSWSLFGLAIAALGVGLLLSGMPTVFPALYFPSAYAIMAGIMYLFGAALWNEKTQLWIGLLLLAIGSVAPFAGFPGNNLVMAGGGLVFLVAAIVYSRRGRNAR